MKNILKKYSKIALIAILVVVMIFTPTRQTHAIALTTTGVILLVSVLAAGGIAFASYEHMTGGISSLANNLASDITDMLNRASQNTRTVERADGTTATVTDMSWQDMETVWNATQTQLRPRMSSDGIRVTLDRWRVDPTGHVATYIGSGAGVPVLSMAGHSQFTGTEIIGNQARMTREALEEANILQTEVTFRGATYRAERGFFQNPSVGWQQGWVQFYRNNEFLSRSWQDEYISVQGGSARVRNVTLHGFALIRSGMITIPGGSIQVYNHRLVKVLTEHSTTMWLPNNPAFELGERLVLQDVPWHGSDTMLGDRVGNVGVPINTVSLEYYEFILRATNVLASIESAQALARYIAGDYAGDKPMIGLWTPADVAVLTNAIPETVIDVNAPSLAPPTTGIRDILQGLANILGAIGALPNSIATAIRTAIFDDTPMAYIPDEIVADDFDFRINLMDYFPFSLPRDLYDIIAITLGAYPAEMAGATTQERALIMHYHEHGNISPLGYEMISPLFIPSPRLPRVEIDIPLPDLSGSQTIAHTWVFDMAEFPTFVNIINWGVFLVFLVGLINITPKVITW